MKKFFVGVVLSVLFVAQSAFAMTFSQPVKVGRILGANMGGFVFDNATVNNGTLSKHGRGKAYDTGVARFGEGKDALYFHYRYGDWQRKISAIMLFGSDDKNNTVPVNVMVADILKINGSNNKIFYVIEDGYDLAEESWYTLIGKKSDGTWVKYFDTVTVGKTYFGSGDNKNMRTQWGLAFYKPETKGDTIIIHYSRNKDGRQIQRDVDERGEFRFKWDDKAQWFGVEQVVY